MPEIPKSLSNVLLMLENRRPLVPGKNYGLDGEELRDILGQLKECRDFIESIAVLTLAPITDEMKSQSPMYFTLLGIITHAKKVLE